MDCSNCNFKQIPSTLPGNTTSLIMKGNTIGILRNFSFVDLAGNFSMSNLEKLDLSNCGLYYIENLALYGLSHLKSLTLSNNRLMASRIAEPRVLHPIRESLTKLDIARNAMCYVDPDRHYMDDFLSNLTNLEDLTIDICGGKLGQGFSKLLSLKRLHLFYSPSGVSHISSDMFDAVKERLIELKLEPSPSELQWSTYNVISRPLTISKGAFEFSKLTVLDLSWTYLGPDAGLILTQLGNCPVEKLFLDHVGIYSSSYLDMNRYSRNLTNLRYISLEGNAIGGITVSPYRIEVISYAQNIFTPYLKYVMMLQLPLFYNMKGFNISYQQAGPDYPQYSKDVCKLATYVSEYENIPQNLEWIDVSHQGLYFSEMKDTEIGTNNSLKRIYAKNANFNLKSLDRIITCADNVRPSIDYIDLSENRIECINSSIFAHCDWSSLRYLNLRKNFIGQHHQGSCRNANVTEYLLFLRLLVWLEELDLSENRVDIPLPENSFQGLYNLRVLKLARMGLEIFRPSLASLKSLEFLDLSGNKLSCLSPSTLGDFDVIMGQRKIHFNESHAMKRLSVDISANALVCDCECLPFYKWLNWSTNVEWVNLR